MPKPKLIVRNGLRVFNPPIDFVEEVLSLYTIRNPAYANALAFSPWGKVSDEIPKVLTFAKYRRKNKVLSIPRGFDSAKLSPKWRKWFDQQRCIDKRAEAPVEHKKSYISPKKDQRTMIESFKAAENAQKRPLGAFLVIAPTSSGKTLGQAFIAASTGQRVLILCATNLIKNSWYRDLYMAYKIKREDIGLIQQKTWKIGEHFTIASIATLQRRKERWKELFASIGCVIADEIHMISEPRLQEFLKACPCKYIIGATATEKKDNGGNFYLPTFFGEPIVKLKTSNKDTATSMALRKVRVVNTDFLYSYDRLNLDIHDLDIHLAGDEERNRRIVAEAMKDWKKGHSVVIAVKRVAHVLLIREILREHGVKDANYIYGGSNTKKRYTESLTRAILNRNVRMVVATIQAIKLGANLNPLNRLHVAYPPNRLDLEQLIGRIRRRDKLKKDNAVVYYLDKRVQWLRNRYIQKAIPVFREQGAEGFVDLFVA